MYCRYCGKEIPKYSNFCPNCGKKQSKNGPNGKSSLFQFFVKHKKSFVAYALWCLIHIGLLVFSSPGEGYEVFQGFGYIELGSLQQEAIYGYHKKIDEFYPFDTSLSNIMQGGKFWCDPIENIKVYDSSELFFYTILFPIIILGAIRLFPYLTSTLKKMKGRYEVLKIKQNKKNDNQIKETQTHKVSIVDNSQVGKEEISTTIDSTTVETVVQEVDNNLLDFEKVNSSLQEHESIIDEQTITVTEPQKMPMIRRFVGTMIDKFILIVVFVIGFLIISPYEAPSKLGSYIGLLKTSPDAYEKIDKVKIIKYESGEYYGGVSTGYQDLVRAYSESPHIGSTKENDLNITISIIILNLLYYFLSECFLSASLGKRMLGGLLIDSAGDKIGFGKAFSRCLWFGALMVGIYYLFHLQIAASNFVVLATFFLLLDLPVLFTKKSLLDICTGTTYIKMFNLTPI